MTSEKLAMLRTRSGYCVEASTGWFMDTRIYGLTTNAPGVENACHHNWDEFVAAITEVLNA